MRSVIFLPGVVAPAAVRYGPLLERLPEVRPQLKDLEVYAEDSPPAGYETKTEVDAIDAAITAAGLDAIHVYAHSGGGACALAYVAAHPQRVLSLVVDEPATDFSDADRSDPYWRQVDAAAALEGPASVAAFLQLQVAPGVALTLSRSGPAPSWLAKRPAGIKAFAAALRRHRVPEGSFASFKPPVLFTYGSLTHPRWMAMRDRLADAFPDFRSEEFAGLHHMNTSHQAEPDRTATLLTEFWTLADARR